MTGQAYRGFGKVITNSEANDSFVIELDPASNPPVRTVQAFMALGKYMGDIGADGPRFLPRRPAPFKVGTGESERTIHPNLYLPPFGEEIFVMLVGQSVAAWSFKKWYDSADREVKRRIWNDARKAEQEEADRLNRLFDDISDQVVVAPASGSETVFVSVDEGVAQESTIGDVVATSSKPTRKGRPNGSATAQHQSAQA